MKADLASGAWVEMRDIAQLNAKDKLVMQQAMKLPFDPGNPGTVMEMTAGMVARQSLAVMGRIITGWSFQLPLPADDASSDSQGQPAFEQSLLMLPIDDYNELEELTDPYLEKLRGGGPKSAAATTSSSNGSSKAKAASSPQT